MTPLVSGELEPGSGLPRANLILFVAVASALLRKANFTSAAFKRSLLRSQGEMIFEQVPF